jgi:hypothetical protein
VARLLERGSLAVGKMHLSSEVVREIHQERDLIPAIATEMRQMLCRDLSIGYDTNGKSGIQCMLKEQRKLGMACGLATQQ